MEAKYFQTSPHYTIKKNVDRNLLVVGPAEDRLLIEPLQNKVLELLIDNNLSLQDFVMQPAFPQGTHPLYIIKYIQALNQQGIALLGKSVDELEFPDLHLKPYPAAHNQLSNSYHLIELDYTDFRKIWEPYTNNQVPDSNSLTIVVTDHFLDERIEEIYLQMIRNKQSWMLFKPFGSQIMVSPIFNGEDGACWQSMVQRMRLHRPLLQMQGFETLQKATPYYTKESLETAIQFLVDTLETAEDLQDHLYTYGLGSGETEKHWVVKRSEAGAQQKGIFETDQLFTETESIVNQDGGYRTLTALETFERYKHHISPVTGVISEIEPYRGNDYAQLHNFTSGRNLALQSKSMFWLNNHRRSCSGGKGKSEQQAKTGALCEAIERYSMMHHGQPAALQSSLAALGSKGIHPNTCMNFSNEQFANREETNENSTAFYALIPVDFDENTELDWTEVHALTSNKEKYLPSAFCYAQYPRQDERNMIAYPDSNGCAAGNTHAEAALQGTLELIERDAAAIWWYNKIRRPKVDLKVLNTYIKEMLEFYESEGRSLEVLDITTDIGIPTFVAVSFRKDGGKGILFGFGCHIDAAIAVERSIIELNQLLPITLGKTPKDMDENISAWLENQSIIDNLYLQPSTESIDVRKTYPVQSFGNLGEVLKYVIEQFKKQSLDLYLLDLTQQDIGMPVVKMIAPSLRHYWRRTGPGRLYEVPVKMGWLAKPHTEDELNKQSIVI